MFNLRSEQYRIRKGKIISNSYTLGSSLTIEAKIRIDSIFGRKRGKIPVQSTTPSKTVIFDEQLTFNHHISEVCRTANFHLRALSHIRKYIDSSTANTIASCIVSSRIDYCNSLFAGITDHNLLRLQRIQNRAAKIVTNSFGIVSCSALLRQLHWLPVPNRIDYKIALLTFKALTNQQPAYLHSLLQVYSTGRTLRSSSQHLLAVPNVKTSFHARAFSVYAPKVWNRLPQHLRDCAFDPAHLTTPPMPSTTNSRSTQFSFYF